MRRFLWFVKIILSSSTADAIKVDRATCNSARDESVLALDLFAALLTRPHRTLICLTSKTFLIGGLVTHGRTISLKRP